MDLSPEQNQVAAWLHGDRLSDAPDAAPSSPRKRAGHEPLAGSGACYYGQYLYRIPTEVRMRFVSRAGQPLQNATVKMYQLEERPGVGHLITPQIKAQGMTDQDGIFVLPNVPVDPDKVPPLPTGDVLHANPFGYVAVIGANGLLHFRVEHEGMVDYAWLDITEPNVALLSGADEPGHLRARIELGGLLQRFPPVELTETMPWTGLLGPKAARQAPLPPPMMRRISRSDKLRWSSSRTAGRTPLCRYPGAFRAQWDLTGVQTLKVRFFAAEPQSRLPRGQALDSPLGSGRQFISSISITLTVRRRDILNDALEQWCAYSIPLDVRTDHHYGWRRTAFGAPDLTGSPRWKFMRTRGRAGFTLWIDGVSFAPTPAPTMSLTPAPGGLNLCWPATYPVPVLEAAEKSDGAVSPAAGDTRCSGRGGVRHAAHGGRRTLFPPANAVTQPAPPPQDFISR